MATKKAKRGREQGRGKGKRSGVGRPLDVRSAAGLKEMESLLKMGPVTMMLIYADWCGHCHQLMPHWDKAAASPNRSVQAVKVNEQMMSQVNAMVNQKVNQVAAPINVSAYPTIIMVDNQGNKVTEVEPVKDTAALTKAMNQVGPLAEEAGLGAPSIAPSVPSVPSASWEAEAEAAAEGESPFPSMMLNRPSSKRSGPMGDIPDGVVLPSPPSMVPQQDALRPHSLYSTMPLGPPNQKGTIKGGSLYASLTQSAYTLAPAATLFGIAAMMERRDRSSQKGRKGRKGRKSQKRRKGGVSRKSRKGGSRRRRM